MRQSNKSRGQSDTDHTNPRVAEAMELYLHQLEAGTVPDRVLFLTQFADVADELAGQLEVLEFLNVATPDIFDASHNTTVSNRVGANEPTLGDFRLLRQIGRGGMGIVYEALQISLDRRVAVKILPFEAMFDAKQRKRFQNEARAAATLDHPSIVPIYFIGQERGLHFYAMRLIEGQSLTEVIQGMKTLEKNMHPADCPATSTTAITRQRHQARQEFYRSVARLGMETARALQHAHEQGVVHRDIKPGNLLLDETGKIWIADFGLARIDRSDSMTGHGDVLGTIAYMSPEQISGSSLVDARSDIYSLAVTLYELLTLHRPFPSCSARDVLPQRGHSVPASLRSHDPEIPSDLETIVLKAMSDDLVDRYQSAEAFAADLQNLLAGQPIQARRPSLADRLIKWTWRHRKLAVTFGLTIALLCVLLMTSIVLVSRARHHAVRALRQSKQQAEVVQELLYMSNVSLAYQAWDSEHLDQVHKLLSQQVPSSDQRDRRGFEWFALNSLAEKVEPLVVGQHEGSVNQIAVFPDGKRVASVGVDKKLRIWDIQSNRPLSVIDMGNTSMESLFSVAVSPDGKTVATGSDCVQLWDADTGKRRQLLTSLDYNVQSIAFSPDGRRIAVASRYDRVQVFSASGELIQEIMDSSRHETLEFTPDSQRLIVPSRRTVAGNPNPEGFIRVWDADLVSVASDFYSTDSDGKNYALSACSPDGEFYVFANKVAQHALHLVEASSGKELMRFPQHRDQVTSVAISRDSRSLAAGYLDGTVTVWNIDTRGEKERSIPGRKLVLHAHRGGVTSIRFLANRQLISGGNDGYVKLWELQPAETPTFVDSTVVSDIAFAPNSRAIALRTNDGLCLLDAQGRPLSQVVNRDLGQMSFSRDSRLLALCNLAHRTIDIHDVPSGTRIHSLPIDSAPRSVSFSPTEDALAVVSALGNVTMWKIKNWQPLVSRLSVDGEREYSSYRCVHSPDGRFLLCAGEFGEIVVIDPLMSKITQRVSVLTRVEDICFRRDARILATCHSNGTIQLWSWPGLTPVGTLTGHQGPVSCLEFAPGGRLISHGTDGTTRVWSTTHFREFGILHRRNHPGWGMALSPDGTVLCLGYNVAIGRGTPLSIFRFGSIAHYRNE
jgi:serine/threonine protein kinase